MYYIIFFLIIVSILFEFYSRSKNKMVFNFVYILMTIMVVFRYGQGTDYFGYMYHYYNVDLSSIVYQKDIGYSLLIFFSNELGVSFELFSAFFGLLTMALFYPFFKKTCGGSMLPMLIFYAYVLLIFPMSGIRQGFTLALLLGILYPLLVEKKYLYFYVFLILGSFIHLSLIICAIFPILLNFKINKRLYVIVFIVMSVINFLNLNLYIYIPFELPGNRGIDLASAEDAVNLSGKLLRFVIIFILLIIPEKYYSHNSIKIRNIVFTGYIVYSLLSFVGTVAGRIEIYFRVFEMLLLFLLLYENKIKNIIIYQYVFVLFYSILFFKNINSQIVQGEYINTSILSYPYVTIFNPDKIEIYRKDNSVYLFRD